MHTATNKDVWGHIVKYFRMSLSDDSVEDIQIKRRTLRSIALVSSQLAAAAVSELWRSMETLEPVIHAFNAPPFHVSSPAFEYKHDSSDYYWEMAHGSDYFTNDVASRALDYLSHVRYLHFTTYPSLMERTLWKALLAVDWINPLCPNLRGIRFTAGNNNPSAIYDLVPLLVPSLQSIRFDSAITTRDEVAVSMLLDLIKFRKIQISDILYVGYTSPRIVKQIFQFPKLHSAKVLGASGSNSDDFLETSDIQSFRPSTLLTNLDIDLGMFQFTFELGGWVNALQSLTVLSLQGTAPMVIEFLHNRSFALVHSLSLSLRQPNGAPSVAPNIFSIIFPAFPILHSLYLENKEDYNIMNEGITLSDIQVLRERPMQCLVLYHLRFSLSLSNVIEIVETWPTLERLSLVPDPRINSEIYDADKLLPFISRHAPHVTDLNLPLDVSTLCVQPLSATTTVCPLQRLELTLAYGLSLNLEENLMLAQNLLTLFPKLCAVKSNWQIEELQAIVKSFQRTLSAVLRRGNNVY